MCLFNKISFVLLVCALAVPKVLKIVPVATLGETLDSVSTVFNEIAQHPPHTLFAVCNWSIGHPR